MIPLDALNRLNLQQLSRSALESQLVTWSSGIDFEITFWRSWFESKGMYWQDDYLARLDPDRSFPEELASLLPGGNPGQLRILDVGSGPLSVLGPVHRGTALNITACDPLAQHYNEMMAEFGIRPVVPVTRAFVEDLSAYFSLDTFDLVYCRNALDHSFDPMRGLLEMLLVTRAGCKVVVRHHCNEAENAKYRGFHQWNFCLRDGRFVIWNPSCSIDVEEALAPLATVAANLDDGDVTAVITKAAPVEASDLLAWKNGRIRDLLEALANAGASAGGAMASGVARPASTPGFARKTAVRLKNLVRRTLGIGQS